MKRREKITLREINKRDFLWIQRQVKRYLWKLFLLILKICLLIVSTFLFLGLLSMPLAVIDILAPTIAKYPHNISGSTWFSAIASLFSVVSSVLMGLFAMRQTERANKLQEYYQRPKLMLKDIKLEIAFVNWSSYFQSNIYKGYSLMQKSIIKGYKNLSEDINYACMQLTVDFILRNDIGVDSASVENMVFAMGGKEYKFVNRYENTNETENHLEQEKRLKKWQGFRHKFMGYYEEYTIQEVLLHLVPDDKEAWNALMQVSQTQLVNPEYKSIDAEIEVKLDFVTNVERSETLKIKALLSKAESIDKAVFCVSADSGRVIYV